METPVNNTALSALASVDQHEKNNPRLTRKATNTGGALGVANNMAREKSVTISVAQHDALKKNTAEHVKLKKDFKALQKELEDLRKRASSSGSGEEDSLRQEIDEANAENEKLTEENAKKDELVLQLKSQLEESRRALVSTGSVDESKLNMELVMHTENAAKTALFRTWKFIENEEDLVTATEELIDYLPIELDTPNSDYVALYKGKVSEALSKARQYVQSEAKKRAFEWWTKHKTIPSVEDIFTVLKIPTHKLELPEHSLHKELLLWYVDRFLPVAAGKEYFGEEIRYYQRITSAIKVNGELRVAVTVASEAFGLLVLDNCQQKWQNIFELKEKEGPNAVIPTKGPVYEAQFKAKYTDSKCGRVKFGGWDEAAYAFYKETKGKVKAFRTVDAANAFDTQNYALQIVRAAHEITEDGPNKKRKRSKKSTAPAPVPVRRITREIE